jgi:hypothetical protein
LFFNLITLPGQVRRSSVFFGNQARKDFVFLDMSEFAGSSLHAICRQRKSLGKADASTTRFPAGKERVRTSERLERRDERWGKPAESHV